MGIISRHAGAPFEDGETLAGADLENDFATMYDEFNGGIDSANLEANSITGVKLVDDSITTAKIADEAVTQDKLEDGAATMSEAVFHAAAVTLTTAYSTIGNSITHAVGDPARQIIIMAQCQNTSTSARINTYALYRDGSLVADTEISVPLLAISGTIVDNHFNAVWVDTSPTAGGSHTYEFKAKTSTGTSTVAQITFVAIELRA